MIENLFSRIAEKFYEARKQYEKRMLGDSGTVFKDMEEYKLFLGKKQGILECEALLRQVYQELHGSALQETIDGDNQNVY